MLHIDTSTLAGDNKEAVDAADAANAEAAALQANYQAMLDAIHEYNKQLDTTKTAFATFATKIGSVKTVADGLSQQTADFPEPVVEPAPWPLAPQSTLPKSFRKK